MPLIKPAGVLVLRKLLIFSFGLRRLKCLLIIKRAELCLGLNLEVGGGRDLCKTSKGAKVL